MPAWVSSELVTRMEPGFPWNTCCCPLPTRRRRLGLFHPAALAPGPSVSCHPLAYFPPQALLPEACSHPLVRASWFRTSGTLGDSEGN